MRPGNLNGKSERNAARPRAKKDGRENWGSSVEGVGLGSSVGTKKSGR